MKLLNKFKTYLGLSTLTGFPCDAIRLEKKNLCRSEEEEIDYDIVWAKLLSMKEAGYAMGG
jgi:calpain-15